MAQACGQAPRDRDVCQRAAASSIDATRNKLGSTLPPHGLTRPGDALPAVGPRQLTALLSSAPRLVSGGCAAPTRARSHTRPWRPRMGRTPSIAATSRTATHQLQPIPTSP